VSAPDGIVERAPPAAAAPAVAQPSRGEALRVWGRVAALSFGGPAGQIAVMQRILVEEKRWVSQERFLHALNFCMLLPGPEAQQLAIYMGWLLNGTWMGIAAGTLFVLPGLLSILGLSVAYVLAQGTGVVQAILYGLKPAVLAIVVEALLRLGRRALAGPARMVIALVAAVTLFLGLLPYPILIAAAALAGWLLGRAHVGGFGDAPGAPSSHDAAERVAGWPRALRVVATWVPIWWGPVLLASLLLGPHHVVVREGVFFGETAMVTFGGAYAVLAYVAQQAVGRFGWLSPREMLDGLGMAETTPGPLIQVVQFVAFLGAWRAPAPLSPLAAAVLGSLLTAWVTFAPCFLWIFLGAPHVERLRGRRGLADALAAITAAVVGVILQLAVWFALHVLFATVREVPLLVGHVWVPDVRTIDFGAVVIALLSCWLLFRTRAGMLGTLAAAVAAGALWRWLA